MTADVPAKENASVREVLPSYYWPQNAIIVITDCGHRHARPITMKPDIGATFHCPFCASEKAHDDEEARSHES